MKSESVGQNRNQIVNCAEKLIHVVKACCSRLVTVIRKTNTNALIPSLSLVYTFHLPALRFGCKEHQMSGICSSGPPTSPTSAYRWHTMSQRKHWTERSFSREDFLLAVVCGDTRRSRLITQRWSNSGVSWSPAMLRHNALLEGERSLLSQQAAGNYPAHLQFIIWAVEKMWLTAVFEFKLMSNECVLSIISPPTAWSSASVHQRSPALPFHSTGKDLMNTRHVSRVWVC